ncbi:acidic fibroblast growth factor intracellular-binding protein [Striga asiatica]|uniref:Acidic fibroblast growth factor intracellular-binding protein n=1 Tax=Striga asiatica TaxID=4170 RepID=A0A5A7PRZ5_STRAF|nr:acidic fibroblast growth factor intracellular-binding protein [Striga asiatica]
MKGPKPINHVAQLPVCHSIALPFAALSHRCHGGSVEICRCDTLGRYVAFGKVASLFRTPLKFWHMAMPGISDPGMELLIARLTKFIPGEVRQKPGSDDKR